MGGLTDLTASAENDGEEKAPHVFLGLPFERQRTKSGTLSGEWDKAFR